MSALYLIEMLITGALGALVGKMPVLADSGYIDGESLRYRSSSGNIHSLYKFGLLAVELFPPQSGCLRPGRRKIAFESAGCYPPTAL